MKSKEELNALKEEIESVNEKLQELTEEELEQVTGGGTPIGLPIVAHDFNFLKDKNTSVIVTESKY